MKDWFEPQQTDARATTRSSIDDERRPTLLPYPDDETGRLAALAQLRILDSASEQVFDDLVTLASEICGTPIALVSLIDQDRQWFKARVGLRATETPRDLAFCGHAIVDPARVFTVTDAKADRRFADNALVTGDPHIRFYAGAPIVTEEGHALGTVCVIDTQPRVLTESQNQCLRVLARQASGLLALRKQSIAAAELATSQAHMTTEARLKQEKGVELLDLVLQGRGLGLWDLDVPSGCWTASSHELAILGYADGDADMPRSDWTQLVHPDDLPLTRSSMAAHLRGDARSYECTIRMRHRRGHWIWVLSRAVVVERTAESVPLRIVGTHEDVTEQRRREEERRQNAERIELAMSGGNLGLWDLDVSSGKVVYSAQWAEMLGYALAEVESRPDFWKEVMHPQEGSACIDALRQHLRGDAPLLEIEVRMRHKLGHWVWMLTRARVHERDALGQPTRLVGININITSRKHSEFALVDEIARRRALLDHATEFVFVLDERLRLIEANTSFVRALGYSDDALRSSRPWQWDALTPTAEQFRDRWSGQTSTAWTAETQWRRKDGTTLDVAMSCTTVSFDRGRELLFVCRDITEAKRSRAAIERARQLLEETGRLAQVGGWEFDLRSSRITWSEEVYRIHELDSSWVPNLTDAVNFYAAEARPVIAAAVKAAIDHGTPYDLELALVTARGRRIWVRAIGKAEHDDGHAIRIVGAFQDITERRNAQEALRHGEQRLTLALESSKQSIFEWDVRQGMVHLSSHMSVTRGGAPAAMDLTLQDFIALIHPADRESLRATLNDTVTGTHHTYEHEHRIRRIDDGWSWIRSVGRVSQRDVGGIAIRLSAIDEDVTSRKVAEQALIRSEKRLRMITDHTPALITYIDREERYAFVNAHFGKVFGIEPQSIVGRTMQDVCGDQVYADIAPHIRKALRGEATQFEATGLARGQAMHYQSHYVPDVGVDGVVAGFYALIFDVTARRDAEIKSEENERRLRGIADNVPALISELGRDGRFRFANATYRHWFGVDHHAIVGLDIRSAIGDPYYADREHELRRALDGETVSFERQVMLAAGERTLRSTYVPHFDDVDRVAGVYALTSDITDLKRTQMHLDALARADTLTRLPNRRHFEEHAAEALARARRSGRTGVLFYLDVDRFKAINDSLGHAGGDEVLQEFARRLRDCLRETDFVARYAGDEFVALAEGIACEADAIHLAEKIVASVRGKFTLSSVCMDVTTSVGVAIFDGREPLKALLARADAALYVAKQRGRDDFSLATAVEPADDNLTLIDAMAHTFM